MTTHPDISISLARSAMADREATAASRRLVQRTTRRTAPAEHQDRVTRRWHRTGTAARASGVASA